MFSRPLPTPPGMPGEGFWRNDYLDPMNDPGSPFYSFRPNPSFGAASTAPFSDHPTTLRGGTILHKGFYDLLALIPSTPSPSRFFWPARPSQDSEPVAGPRYEEIPSSPPPLQAPSSPQPLLRKGRRISKDMVSNPTGFVYVLHSF
jgi:protein-serine/threonine kinase